MHVSLWQFIAVVALIGLISALAWVCWIYFRKEEHTRERFAFAALAAVSSLVATIVGAMADKQTFFGELAGIIRSAHGEQPVVDSPHVGDHLLMVLVLVVFVIRVYERWEGAISVRHYEKSRYHEPAPWVSEGLREAKRVLLRQPPLKIFKPQDQGTLRSALESPQYSPAWHVEARELFCLGNPSYRFDPDEGWHREERCRVGFNRRTGDLAALKCVEGAVNDELLGSFVSYVRRISTHSKSSASELFVATRDASAQGSFTLGDNVIKALDEVSLLDNLVDFSDYYADVVNRVERQTLPDSRQTISDVYVPPKCRREDGDTAFDLERFLSQWVNEPGQRQLALLGEYGQGKSTACLMFAYQLIRSSARPYRVPVLVELRGRSPRNMTAEDIIAAWA